MAGAGWLFGSLVFLWLISTRHCGGAPPRRRHVPRPLEREALPQQSAQVHPPPEKQEKPQQKPQAQRARRARKGDKTRVAIALAEAARQQVEQEQQQPQQQPIEAPRKPTPAPAQSEPAPRREPAAAPTPAPAEPGLPTPAAPFSRAQRRAAATLEGKIRRGEISTYASYPEVRELQRAMRMGWPPGSAKELDGIVGRRTLHWMRTILGRT